MRGSYYYFGSDGNYHNWNVQRAVKILFAQLSTNLMVLVQNKTCLSSGCVVRTSRRRHRRIHDPF